MTHYPAHPMSASAKKDRVFTVGVYRGPPQLSQKELTSKVDALVDEFLALPVAQKNFLKFTVVRPPTYAFPSERSHM